MLFREPRNSHTENCSTNNRSMLDLCEDGRVDADSASSDISSLAHETEASDSALAAANGGRVKETNDLTKPKVELTGVVNTLKLATSVIKKEMTKNPVLVQKKLDTDVTINFVAVLTAAVDEAEAGGAGAENRFPA